MSSCARIQAHLNDFLDGTLGATQSERLNAHLQECAVCRAEFRALKATQELVRHVAVPGGDEAQKRVMARFRRAVVAEPAAVPAVQSMLSAPWRMRLLPMSAAAIALGTLCLILLPGVRLNHEAASRTTSPVGPIVIATAACNAALPTAGDLDQMTTAHAVQSFTLQNGSDELQRETLADANSRLSAGR